MLPKKNRLTYLDFRQNPSREVKINYNYLLFFSKSGFTCPRFTINIPKRIEKLSSRRHFIKRIIVEIIRKKLALITKKMDVLIKVKKTVGKTNIVYLEKEIGEFLIRINSYSL